MTSLENGMLVQHASLGVGKVVAVEPNAVHVVFASQDARVATKLRLPMALSYLSPSARPDAWLSGLSGFELDEKTGRYGRGSGWLTHAEAVARFTEAFPLAFADPAYLDPGSGRADRAHLWRRAQRAFAERFGEGRGEALLASRDVPGLVKRTLEVERIVRPLLRGGPSRIPFEELLGEPGAARGFFAALLDLLAAGPPDRARFDALAASVAALAPAAAPEARWPAVTLLPFVARPDVHVLLRPHAAADAAQRLGLDLAYDAEPNWVTYASLLASSGQLLERLRPLGASDHVDVDAFVHAATAKQPRPKTKPGPAAVAAGVRARQRSVT